MGYRLVLSDQAKTDAREVFRFIQASARSFGETSETAFKHASRKTDRMEDALERLASTPHQGTLWHDLYPNIRYVTKARTFFYFFAEDDTETLRVVAIFYGGQDHQRHMLRRLADLT